MYFCFVVDTDCNELLVLETIDRYVVLLDRYFGSVCESDLVVAFDKAHHVLDELVLGGELHETSIVEALRALHRQDALAEDTPSWLSSGAVVAAISYGGRGTA
jgi:AP-1 complex subunit sigma 1/2